MDYAKSNAAEKVSKHFFKIIYQMLLLRDKKPGLHSPDRKHTAVLKLTNDVLFIF